MVLLCITKHRQFRFSFRWSFGTPGRKWFELHCNFRYMTTCLFCILVTSNLHWGIACTPDVQHINAIYNRFGNCFQVVIARHYLNSQDVTTWWKPPRWPVYLLHRSLEESAFTNYNTQRHSHCRAVGRTVAKWSRIAKRMKSPVIRLRVLLYLCLEQLNCAVHLRCVLEVAAPASWYINLQDCWPYWVLGQWCVPGVWDLWGFKVPYLHG